MSAPIRVLVVEDSRAMRQIIIRTLRQAGWHNWRIEQADNGAQALAMVAEQEPDLVLADWNMPHLSGIDLLRTLRLRGYSTPFCFISSQLSDEQRRQATAAGALGLIGKPFTPQAFREMLAGLADRDPQPAEEPEATAAISTLPSSLAIRELLERLLDREVEAGPCPPPVMATAVLGLYADDRDRMTAVLTLDLPLAAYLGSALALLPPATAESAIAEGELTPSLAENVDEVLDVFTAVLNPHPDTHQRLYATYPGPQAPADAAAHSKALGNRLDLQITVHGYGTGTLSYVLVN
jgi:CheY-like chemotaxis protein